MRIPFIDTEQSQRGVQEFVRTSRAGGKAQSMSPFPAGFGRSCLGGKSPPL
jgi:hypothetical protein